MSRPRLRPQIALTITKKDLIDTLRDIEAGGLLDELSETQHKLIDAIRLTGKGGELNIKLTYPPDFELAEAVLGARERMRA